MAHIIDTRPYEILNGLPLCDDLVPRIHSAVVEAMDVLGSLLEHYDTPSKELGAATSGAFDVVFEQLIETTDTAPSPRQRIVDVSFMARWELERKHRAFELLQHPQDQGQLLSECCSARRRVIKATSGVEQVLSEVEGCPSVFEGLYRTERQRAVETRAAYHSFASGLRKLQGDGDRIERDLRLVGTGIARLVGRDIYVELRVKDRLELRKLQGRIRTWLIGADDSRSGQRLIGDVKAFAALLMKVNHRPELIEHDREVLRKLQAVLDEPGPDTSAVFPLLESMRGRDVELDELIDTRAVLRPQRWAPPVDRLLRELSEPDRS